MNWQGEELFRPTGATKGVISYNRCQHFAPLLQSSIAVQESPNPYESPADIAPKVEQELVIRERPLHVSGVTRKTREQGDQLVIKLCLILFLAVPLLVIALTLLLPGLLFTLM